MSPKEKPSEEAGASAPEGTTLPDAPTLLDNQRGVHLGSDEADVSGESTVVIPGVAEMREQIGQQVGQTRIISCLGRGGMGLVYLGWQEAVRRNVAVKFLAPQLATDAGRTRFEREYQQLARLRHHNLPQIFEIGELERTPYYVMEYLSGGSLEDVMQTGRPLEEQVRLLADAARGVGAGHAQGLVHRDIKPANILLDEQRVAKVADFGLVRILGEHEQDTLTRSGDMLGTPLYMSPEQAMGRHDEVCPATDVFAFGVILYRMLYARFPFARRDSPVEQGVAIVNETPDFPSGPPRLLVQLCRRCLAKQISERFADAGQLAEALDDWSTGAPSQWLAVLPGRPLARRVVVGLSLIALALGGRWVWQVARGKDAGDKPPGKERALKQAQRRPASQPASEGARRDQPPADHKRLFEAAGRDFRIGLEQNIRSINWQRDGSPMVLVGAGQFEMGSSATEIARCQQEAIPGLASRFADYANEAAVRRVHLDAFYIDRHPVTWRQYEKFLLALRKLRRHPTPWCHPDEPRGTGHDPTPRLRQQTGALELYRKPDLPMVCVTWWDATAYAQWAGKRLPSEAQWEKAAGWDPQTNRASRYPWGDVWERDRCNSVETWAGREILTYVLRTKFWRLNPLFQTRGVLKRVGSYPRGASAYGAEEMAGGVQEWTADHYGQYRAVETGNPRGPSSGKKRVVRGGCWSYVRAACRTSYRHSAEPNTYWLAMGFRCVSR